MNKKGMEGTFWIIIGAVIALVVLIVLLVIFTGKVGPVSLGLMDCQSKGGFCLVCSKETKNCQERCEIEGVSRGYEESSYSSVFSCPIEGEACCLGVKREGG